MWILKWIPDFVFYLILLTGLVGFFITFLVKYIPVPALYIHRFTIQIASLLTIMFGSFMVGAVHDNNAWQKKVDELKEKLAVAESQSKEANVQINTKTEKQKEKIVTKEIVVKQYIEKEVAKYDNKCELPKEFIEAHNKSAEDTRK